jgi:CPA2 family monovalent cation:H+ antiporter-2
MLVGRSLATANVRRVTGVTIMAIEREEVLMQYPTGEVRFRGGDRLLAVGNTEEHQAFEQLMNQ